MGDWCDNCQANVEVAESGGTTCCIQCGTVLENYQLSKDVDFIKDGPGSGRAAGVIFRGEGNELSRQVAEERGRRAIDGFMTQLRMGGSDVLEGAVRSYKMAWHLGFVRGRRADEVAAASLYLKCRLERLPIMMIELADILGINVFQLGKVYLDLLVLFHMDQQDQFMRPIDPSLYVHRFIEKLPFDQKSSLVATTALRLIASMKRDWMITGRRPSGICGAALFLAAHIHGFPEMRKMDIIRIVHVGQTTIQTRLDEFSQTTMAQMTPDEFDIQALRHEQQLLQFEENPPQLPIQDPNFECQHVGNNKQAFFALGLCKECFLDMIKVTPDFVAGQKDPPSFTRGIRKIKKQRKNKQLQIIDKTGQEEILLVQDLDSLSKQFDLYSQQETDDNLRDEQLEDPSLQDQTQQTVSQEADQSVIADEESIDESSVPETLATPEQSHQISDSQQLQQTIPESEQPHDTQVHLMKFSGDSDVLQQQQQGGSQEGSESADVFSFDDSECGSPVEGQKRKQSDEDKNGGSDQDSDAFDLDDDADNEDDKRNEVEEDVLSDLSDVDEHFLTPTESELRRQIWEHEFKEWEIEFKAKEESRKQKALSTKSRKKRKKIEGPVQEAATAKEAVENLLKTKSFSRRFNYEALDDLFGKDDGDKSLKPDESTKDIDFKQYEKPKNLDDISFLGLGLGDLPSL